MVLEIGPHQDVFLLPVLENMQKATNVILLYAVFASHITLNCSENSSQLIRYSMWCTARKHQPCHK